VEPELRAGNTLRSAVSIQLSAFSRLRPLQASEISGLAERGRLAAEGLQGASMAKDLTWDDADDIGILLSEKHPDVDPLAVRFTELHGYVTALPEFKDDPKKSNESKLEAIQMAWHAEFLDRTQG
jgi:FeS assembly protein IscX